MEMETKMIYESKEAAEKARDEKALELLREGQRVAFSDRNVVLYGVEEYNFEYRETPKRGELILTRNKGWASAIIRFSMGERSQSGYLYSSASTDCNDGVHYEQWKRYDETQTLEENIKGPWDE